MIRGFGGTKPRIGCIPRESGDDPQVGAAKLRAGEVFPARAGMILTPPQSRWPGTGIPRESGDDPMRSDLERFVVEYSPRERG